MDAPAEQDVDPELDLCSSNFNPLKALYSSEVEIPCPSAEKSQSLDEYDVDGRKSKAQEKEKTENVEKVKKKILLEEYLLPVQSKKKVEINVLSRMQDPISGHMEVLHECLQKRIRVRVVTRSFKGIRGVCIGYIEAFDKFFNLVLRDVDEIYRIPSKGQRFYHEEALTVCKILNFSSQIPVRTKKERNEMKKHHYTKTKRSHGPKRSISLEKKKGESSYSNDPGTTRDDPGDRLEDKETDDTKDDDEDKQGLETLEEELKKMHYKLAIEEDSEGEVKEADDDLSGLQVRLALLQEQLETEEQLDVTKGQKESVKTDTTLEISQTDASKNKNSKENCNKIQTVDNIEKEAKTLDKKDKDTSEKHDVNSKKHDVNSKKDLSKNQPISEQPTGKKKMRAADHQCGKIKFKPEDFLRRHANQMFVRGDNIVLVSVNSSLLAADY
ncbi:uncharacterized protein [Antedon mediterranea]|uniref:uncharacterized protein n=1 Tax=Antedon mediterranea TaxID=105859 RepID=UPI003AF8438F